MVTLVDDASKTQAGKAKKHTQMPDAAEKGVKTKDSSCDHAPAAAAAGALNLLPGEELTALTTGEMASVSSKLEEFARLNPDRVADRREDGT